jgi:hypothetical protein
MVLAINAAIREARLPVDAGGALPLHIVGVSLDPAIHITNNTSGSVRVPADVGEVISIPSHQEFHEAIRERDALRAALETLRDDRRNFLSWAQGSAVWSASDEEIADLENDLEAADAALAAVQAKEKT